MITQDLGIATAYGYAKSKGYTGTEEEFAELMASYASTAQTAIEAADRAVEANTAAQSAKTDAAASKTAAQTAAQTATTKASEASQSASTATTKASEARQSASTASAAATSASTSAQTATTAASTANTKASEASESAATATAAKTDAETARDAAAQSASEAAASAESIDPDEFNRKIYAAFATDTATGSIASFPDGADSIPMKDILVHIEPVQEGSGDPSPENVRPITGWTGCVISRSGADMTDPTTYSITFPTEAGTVYGGTLDVTKGELVVDRICHIYEGGMDDIITSRSIDSITKGLSIRTATAYNHAVSGNAQDSFNLIKPLCDKLKATWYLDAISATNCYAPQGNWAPANIIKVDGLTTIDEYDAWCAENKPQISWLLATPITYQLTPQEITSLLGTNNLWADTGDSEVEYRADAKLYITKKITEAVSALS